MKQYLLLIIAVIFSSCNAAPDSSSSTTGHMEHMMENNDDAGHMGHMMHSTNNATNAVFIAGSTVDIATLPLVQPTEILEVKNGDTIELNPTMVRKEINGKQYVMYGYNGQIPGPMIKATQGSTVTVKTTNGIELPTTIHWHGIRLKNSEDGVPNVTQEAILPNGNHTYTIVFPDEGVYWYHPHVREDIQQDLGLYGNILVTPTNTDSYSHVSQEEVLMLDDIQIDAEKNIAPYGKDAALYAMMGKFGNVILVNGETNKVINTKQGAIVRFYITNVANTRTFKFAIPGVQMKVVGSDLGRFEHEFFADSVTLAPAERAIVEAYFEKSGTYTLTHTSPLATFTLATINVSQEYTADKYATEFMKAKENTDVIADIDPFRPYFNKPIDKNLELSVTMGMHEMMNMHHDSSGIEWEDTMSMMNEMSTSSNTTWKLIDTETKKENMDIHWQFKVGDKVKIQIDNSIKSSHPMQHPIHFHGQRFLVLSIDGKENTNLVWKDTVLVPSGSKAIILLDAANPGTWMIHCHIAEHLSSGMMGNFTVTQ